MITGTFGPVTFSASSNRVLTYHGLSGESAARYHDHEIIGQKPRREFLSDGLNKHTFSVRLDAGMGVNPLRELKKMESIKSAGRGEPLILGGDYKGRYTLDAVAHDVVFTDRDGRPIVINATLTLTEYV